MRTPGSRLHCRVLAAAMKARLSWALTTPPSGFTPASCSRAWPPWSMAIALRWPKASRTKSIAAPSFDRAAAPSSERITATASNSTDGVPASWPSAGRREPSASFTPPTLGATILTRAPASSAACFSAETRAPSEPSATRIATARPSSVSFILPISCSAGDGGHVDDRRRRRRRRRQGSRARPSATRRPRSGSMLSRWPTIASRMCAVSTFDSSNTSADARWRLLGRGLAAEEQPRLAVVVGEGLGADAAALARFARPRRCESRRRLSRAESSASELGS